jgi:hypothetical protein
LLADRGPSSGDAAGGWCLRGRWLLVDVLAGGVVCELESLPVKPFCCLNGDRALALWPRTTRAVLGSRAFELCGRRSTAQFGPVDCPRMLRCSRVG